MVEEGLVVRQGLVPLTHPVIFSYFIFTFSFNHNTNYVLSCVFVAPGSKKIRGGEVSLI
jgi:hypothetical protein